MNRINASKGASNAKNEANHEKHIARLACLTPLLATLPDIMLHEHAREVASHVLSAAIEREQRKLVVANLINRPDHMPSSIPSDFVLQVSKTVDVLEEFKKLKRETDLKVMEHKTFLKNQIIKARTLAHNVVDMELKKLLIKHTLELCTVLLKFFRVKYNIEETINNNTIPSLAVTTFKAFIDRLDDLPKPSEDLSTSPFSDTTSEILIYDSDDSEEAKEYEDDNKFLQFLNVKSKNELLDETPDQTSKPRAIIQIRKNTFFSSKQRISESSNHKQNDLDTVRLDNILNLTHLVPSPKSIEIAALILFPASYVIFNIFYWMLII